MFACFAPFADDSSPFRSSGCADPNYSIKREEGKACASFMYREWVEQGRPSDTVFSMRERGGIAMLCNHYGMYMVLLHLGWAYFWAAAASCCVQPVSCRRFRSFMLQLCIGTAFV